ncbi:MAG: type II secretion system GspH family protein [Verrucomicrobium sp.]|jgi:prepilin-type N-terminal cleavage/methylation domain-containing protein|nr:type II secretion system GspH family protein [Verrucomicrobium sp.]MCE2826196.1 type II secretion system GspH family protein [Verrucomicrobium sp.]
MRSCRPSSPRTPVTTRGRAAFTLLELLVVMSIIGILAGMVVGLAPAAATKMKESRVRAELQQLVTLIEAYKARFGVYPPDGIRRVAVPGQGFQTLSTPALSPLFYELSGVYLTNATRADGFFIPRADADDGDGIRSVELQQWFGREGIQNAKPPELRNRLFATDFKEGQYAEVFRRRGDAGYADIEVLAVGFATDASGKRSSGFAWPNNRDDHPVPTNRGLNPWRYVSTNPTNNPGGFDLWAEIPVGRDRVKVIGNWKESN